MKPRDIAYGAVLTALGIMIPVVFGGTLRIFIPPFSATLASHVPVLLAMLISPPVAVMVGLSTAIGFLLSYGASSIGLMITARAATHAIWAWAGALMIKKGSNYSSALIATAPLHGFLEVVAILLMSMVFGLPLTKGTGVSASNATVATIALIVLFGTIGHHAVDSVIAWVVARAARKLPAGKHH
jgi:niacin transporter